MFCFEPTIFTLCVFIVGLDVIKTSTGTPVLRKDGIGQEDIIEDLDLDYVGSTATKQLYITKTRKVSYQYALGFGCNFVYDSSYNLALVSIETLDEVALLDTYFARTQSTSDPVEPVWTSGIDRLGKMKGQWASTGKEINYPTAFMGDWSPGQGNSPIVANYNCVAIWRYCNRQGHGATIPNCTPGPYGTWFTPRPCREERRYICERSI